MCWRTLIDGTHQRTLLQASLCSHCDRLESGVKEEKLTEVAGWHLWAILLTKKQQVIVGPATVLMSWAYLDTFSGHLRCYTNTNHTEEHTFFSLLVWFLDVNKFLVNKVPGKVSGKGAIVLIKYVKAALLFQSRPILLRLYSLHPHMTIKVMQKDIILIIWETMCLREGQPNFWLICDPVFECCRLLHIVFPIFVSWSCVLKKKLPVSCSFHPSFSAYLSNQALN